MKICCFGSLNIDMVFAVNDFVRPGETIQSKGLGLYAGGKGLNQAVAIRKSGVDVLMAGSVGPDGGLLLNECTKHGLDQSRVRSIQTTSGKAVIQVDRHGENCIILHGGANYENEPAFMDKVLESLEAGDYLVVQNEINDLAHLITAAKKRGLLTFLNPSPMDPELRGLPLEELHCLILNEGEGKALTDADQSEEIMRILKRKYPNTEIIMTMGSLGVLYSTQEGSRLLPAYRVEAKDTTGAGDAFTGYYIGLVSLGYDLEIALDLAQRAAAISVTRQGASQSIPNIQEVLAFVF